MGVPLEGRVVMGWDMPVKTNGPLGLDTRVGYEMGASVGRGVLNSDLSISLVDPVTGGGKGRAWLVIVYVG